MSHTWNDPTTNLTAQQKDLFSLVMADRTGRDLRDVLADATASIADKQAVAEVLGGPGSGVRDFPDQ